MSKQRITIVIWIGILVLIASCSSTPTPTPRPTRIPTATPTLLPSPTPSPTPTALPVTLSGNPREAALNIPTPQTNTLCGVVDILDFPVNPPDAQGVTRGGGDFGVYRSRYNGYHAGEDWWGLSRQSTFGAPVYSIGHGIVTYAAPLGWGVDQGIVIVRHTFSDNSTVLSFYGHLDPPSVVLNVGDCVARGDIVGRIGRPRPGPHLHFEIRTHLPNSPGPGYWSTDPTLAGWLPPSEFIWNNRIISSPGVLWTEPPVDWGMQGIGLSNNNTLVVIRDHQLVGINLQNGNLQWTHESSIRAYSAVMDADRPIVYLASQAGQIEALRLPDSRDTVTTGDEAAPPTRLWQTRIGSAGIATLMPLPEGGVVASMRQQTVGISPSGVQLWREETRSRLFDWVLTEHQLIVSNAEQNNTIWAINASGPVSWTVPAPGHLAVTGDQLWIYSANGVYQLNPETASTEQRLALPVAYLDQGDMIGLPDDSLLLIHADRFDRRLIALDANGALRWERSLSDVVLGQANQLLLIEEQPYLVSQTYTSQTGELSVYAIDPENATLVRLFTGGTRNPSPADTWVLEDQANPIILNIGGGHMVALDIQKALEAVTQIEEQNVQ